MRRILLSLALAGTGLSTACTTIAQGHGHDLPVHEMPRHDMQHHPSASAADARQVVRFPEDLRAHTLANMRDHLLALQEIQAALAKQEFDQAGDIAEQRLGMTAMKLHGAHEVAKFMPEGMRNAGTEMHRAASRFALAAKEATASGDFKPVLEAMARITQQCVACHSAYRLQ